MSDLASFDKLGSFYLGRRYDLARGAALDEPVLYDSRDLTTHAVCVGMTGSGKTGLGITLLEEAAIDGIPAIIIDPKGDLGNLLLTFPSLTPEDFKPWVDPDEAARNAITADALAAQTADRWRKGLQATGQDGARIARLRDAVEMRIYTPGGSAGIPLTPLKSFSAPPADVAADKEARLDRISGAVSGVLGLLEIDADPVRSREHILLSTLFDRAWNEGRDLDLPGLVAGIQKPPFEKVGLLDLDSFFPAKDRFALAMLLNNLLASPTFAPWMEGEPIDVQRLLWSPSGKPRLSIISIAHLSDAERMFFVTLLLNEIVSWMRTQAGTSSLRALFYMDEIFGYFPPSAAPPSKKPMLTLLKQARAFGLGCVLATQNPVDLDYKGLANAGTWLIGRLQTERDKARVLDGLEGASSTAGATFDRQKTDATLSALKNRVFLLNNVHEDAPLLMETRFALSYLRGPLTRAQVQSLMQPVKAAAAGSASAASGPAGAAAPTTSARGSAPQAARVDGARPSTPPDVPERFLARRTGGANVVYKPALLGSARIHYTQAKAGVDVWSDVWMLAHIDGDPGKEPWADGESLSEAPDVESAPEADVSFGSAPAALMKPKNYATWTKALGDQLYRSSSLKLASCDALGLIARPGESDGDFRARASHAAREQRDAQVDELKRKYAPKLARVQEKIRTAETRVAREQSQYDQSKISSAISIGSTVLGALFGRKAVSMSSVSRAATAARGVGRAAEQRADVGRAEEGVDQIKQDLANIEAELAEETTALQASSDPSALQIGAVEIKPKKADVQVREVVLAWTPWVSSPDGSLAPGYQ